jgi:hypothetical protein
MAGTIWMTLPDLRFPTLPLKVFVAGGFNHIFVTLYIAATEPVYDGFVADNLSPILLLGLTLIPLTGTGIIDYVVSRRTTRATGSLRVGLRACLWGNLGYVAALLVTALASYPPGFPASAVYGAALAIFLLVQFGLVQGVSQLVGRWGGGHGLRARGDVQPTMGDPAAVRDLATRSNLGAFVRVFTPLESTKVLWRRVGLIVFFVALFFVQRSVFHVTGTEPAETTIVGVVASIGYLVQGVRQRGQPLHVFQEGLVGFTQDQRLIALRWDEIQPLTPHSPLRVTSRNGDQLVIRDTLAHADELKELIRQGVTRVAMSRP